MSYKDSLTIYEELLEGGCTEAQAKIQAHQLGAVTDIMGKIEKDLIWMRVIGAGMIAACFATLWRG